MTITKFIKYENYDIYEDGKVYSHFTNKFLKGEITKQGYLQYTLFVNSKPKRIKAHQLVASAFIQKPLSEEALIVNHIDGNKLNNHYTNLEWTTYYGNNLHAREYGLNNISKSNAERWKDEEWAAKVSHKISQTQRKRGVSKGENNPRFKYKIYDKYGNSYDRHTLKDLLGCSQSYTDAVIRKLSLKQTINNNIIQQYGIYVVNIKNNTDKS